MTQAKILQQAPILFARDLPKTIDYWAEKVGFKTLGVWGDPADFAIAARDVARVMLSQAAKKHQIAPYWRIKNQMWNAYFWVDDARALYEELTRRGANIDYDLGEKPWFSSSASRTLTSTTLASVKTSDRRGEPERNG